jgi:hypothetical protein
MSIHPDIIQASAARFLVDGGEEDAANVLLSCKITAEESGDTWWDGDERIRAVHVDLEGPRAAYEILSGRNHSITESIRNAIEAVLPKGNYLKHFTARAELIEIDADWRAELLEIARGRGIDNQAADARVHRVWSNFRFRSESEVRIARALDKKGVLFLPNCKARLGTLDARRNREADFLVCAHGKWGILEVDGEPFHPPSRTVEDHERDRLFKAHGIRLVEHYDAAQCFEQADAVVTSFLTLLNRS